MAAVIRPRVGVGHGKLILFGEHAAVYGHPALGIPLDLELRVEIGPATEGGWRFPGLAQAEAAVLGRVLRVLAAPSEGGTVRIDSQVPRGLGLGSSAALCVACAAALADAGPPYGLEVWRRAHEAEAIFHGTPSGIDTGLALLHGMHAFRPRPPALPEHERLPDVPLSLVVGWTPRRSSTGALVASLRVRLRAADSEAEAAVRELGELAVLAAERVRSGGYIAAELGELAVLAHRLLVGLGLSTPETDDLLSRGQALGALGGKLSGAGGGGAFYLIAPSWDAATRIAAELARTAEVRPVRIIDGEARGSGP